MQRVILFILMLAGATSAAAQQLVQLRATGTSDTLSSNGDSVVLSTAGMNSLRVQTLDSYSGTWEVQCSVDGTNYDTDDEVNLSLEGASAAAVQSVTDTVAIWTANIAGCLSVRAIATAGFAATDTVVAMQATQSGGGAAGGGSGSTVDPTTAANWGLYVEDAPETVASNLTMMGTVRRDAAASSAGASGENATANTDANGLLWVRVGASDVSSAGGTSIADNAAFTAGTTSETPVGGFYQSTVTACTDGRTCTMGITAQRTAKVTLFTAAGAEITPSTDSTHATAIAATGPAVMLEATTDIDAETAVADGNAVRAKGDYLGRQINILGCGRENRLRGYLANTDGASTALTGMGAQGAGVIIEVWSFIVANSSATDVTVDIRDGTAGSVLTTLMAPATTDTGGGAVVNLNVPITFTANTAVAMDTSAAATTVYVTAVGCSVK